MASAKDTAGCRSIRILSAGGLFLLFLVFFADGFSLASPPVSDSASSDLSTLRRGRITVVFALADAGLASAVAERATYLYGRIRDNLALSSEVEVALLLFTRRLPKDTREQWKQRLPRWLSGVAFTGQNFIVLRVRPGQTSRDLESVLAHELTHVIIKGDYPDYASWPLWFQEGLAMRESRGESIGQFATLSIATLRGRLIPLDELWSHFPDNEAESRLAYAESWSFISFLIGKFGVVSFQSFLGKLRRKGFEEAFSVNYGVGLGAMEEKWRRHVRRRYNWIPLVTGGTAFWTMILGIFFVSLAARRRKDRLLREKWEEEEKVFH
jgi:hypothetical protein